MNELKFFTLRYLVLFGFLIGSGSLCAQLTVHGRTVTVTAGANNLYVGGNILIKSNGVTDGVIDNDATLTVTGNWTNDNANGGKAFSNLDATGTTVFSSAAAAQTIGGTEETHFESVTLNNTFATAPQFTLSNNIQVRETFTITSGRANMGTNTVTVGKTGAVGTVSRDAGCGTTNCFLYNGTLTRHYTTAATSVAGTANDADELFPLGDADGNWRPAYVEITAAPSVNGTVSVLHDYSGAAWHDLAGHNDATWGGGGTTVEVVSQDNWDVSSSGFTDGTYTLYMGGTGFGAIDALTDINLSLANSVVGNYEPATGTTANPLVERSGLSKNNLDNSGGTQTFHIGSKNKGASPLPVELLFFKAMLNGDQVDLSWATATEINNDYFTIERSVDGNVIETVTTVKGAGNTSNKQSYATIDYDPLIGLSYYRISQTDYDGTTKEYDWVAVNYNPGSDKGLTANIYPNPTRDQRFNIQLVGTNGDEEILVVMQNSLGQEVYSKVYVSQVGESFIAVDASKKLTPGIYYVTGSSNDILFREKILIKE